MTDSEQPDDDVAAALATLRAAPERIYHDSQADGEALTRYYAPIDSALDPTELFAALSAHLEATHTAPRDYRPAVELYPWIDLQPSLKLHSIYSGHGFEPEDLIRADAEIERERTSRLQALVVHRTALGPREFEDAFDALEAELPYNCEHVVPQSWFAKHEPMRGDLHHLFACEPRCNSYRGNIPYAEFADDSGAVADCGHRQAVGFEPVSGKGAAARATLYFLLRYPGVVGDEGREAQGGSRVLLDWHQRHPVDDYERHRNAAIAEAQGNRNPMIDHPEWVERIAFETSFSDPSLASGPAAPERLQQVARPATTES